MEYKPWIEQAKEDLKSARYNFEGRKYYVCAFLCQQSIEKLLKSLIIKKEKILIKSHDLILLGRKAYLDKDLLRKLPRISIAYTESRYGIAQTIPAKSFKREECEIYLNIAEEVFQWSKNKI